MGKTRDLFQKIRDTKGTFHAKMGSIKDRNGMDPTEAENIKKKWQEYTEELYKKDLHNPDNHDGVITNLESDTTEATQQQQQQRSLPENQRYQGNILCKEGLDKDRNGTNITEAEDMKKRWQEYTEELYKKIFMTQINMMV